MGNIVVDPLTGQPVLNTNTTTVSGSSSPDVNLVEVNGSPVGLGQTKMAGSLPVAVASDNNIATLTKQSDGSQKTQIVDNAGNVIASSANALAARSAA